MKRIIALTLLLALLLSGCGKKPVYTPDPAATATTADAETAAEETTEATTEPTTVPTTEPAPVYFNPLNGEILDEPFTDRIYANIVSNMAENLPHVGVVKADIVIETFVSMNNIIRCLALYSDIESVDAIGSTRSTRPIFNDIVQHYGFVLSHAGGTSITLKDARDRGIDNFNIDSWEVAQAGTSYRDKEYGRIYENTLFGVGPGIKAYAESLGMETGLERDYGLTFTEDGTPAGGEDAGKITLTFTYKAAKKETVMEYDAGIDKYVWNQYGKVMTDQITDEKEAFTNVIIMQASITNNGMYHAADFNAGGTGYYANGGRIIPILWTCDGDDQPFHFMTTDAEPLDLGMGNTYIAICTPESPIALEPVAPTETVAETTAG